MSLDCSSLESILEYMKKSKLHLKYSVWGWVHPTAKMLVAKVGKGEGLGTEGNTLMINVGIYVA